MPLSTEIPAPVKAIVLFESRISFAALWINVSSTSRSSSLTSPKSVKKLVRLLLHVIPAPYQVRGKLQPESSVFSELNILWTPVFTGVTDKMQFFHLSLL